MKEKIIEKLFSGDDIQLTSTEIAFIARKLSEDKGSSEIIPFNHEVSSIFEACGISPEDYDSLNKNIKDWKIEGEGDKISQLTEMMENLAVSNPKYMRIIMLNCVKLIIEKNNPLLDLLRSLGKKE